MTDAASALAGTSEGRAPGRSIHLDRHPGWRGPRLDQGEVVRLPLIREQAHPLPDHHGVDLEVQLVDQVALEQPAEQLAAAVDLELATGLRLQRADGRLEVPGDDVGVLPRRVLQRRRRDVLGQDVDAV
jgi:hypothetical protein